MSIRGGDILHAGGLNTVIDRLQSAGIGDINIGSDIIRETGNPDNVDKVLQDPDFTFSMESLDVSVEIEALLAGRLDGDASVADQTIIAFSDMKCMHVTSPWKDPALGSAGVVVAGVLIPNYYTTRAQYRFGVNDNAGETFELAGNAYYMAPYDPVVETWTASATASGTYVTTASASVYRQGGYSSDAKQYILGVIVDGDIQIEGADYTVTTAGSGSAQIASIHFAATERPADSSKITAAYFSHATPSFPDSTATHPAPTVKPGAVRGRDIEIRLWVASGGYESSGVVSLRGIQSVTLEGTTTNEIEREMGTVLPIGRTITQRDVNGDVGLHPATASHLFTLLRQITGVRNDEVISVLNEFPVGLEVRILNPRDRTEVLKTLWVPDAKFQIPGTPARAGAVVDFTMRYESQKGNFYVIKGDTDGLTLPE